MQIISKYQVGFILSFFLISVSVRAAMQEIDATHDFNLIENAEIENYDISLFHSFKQYDFNYDGVSCKIVRPIKANKNRNWVIRARFWGHQPQADIALLEKGFHIVYCDVSNLYGGPIAVKRWNKFYRLMQKGGLSKKAALEGMSRGGLIIYNWAVENPNKVACIYADAPVLDGKSWPGGFGKGKGYPKGWEEFKEVYRLNNEKKVQNFKGDPIHKIGKIVKAGFPMFHVCGAADKVVPIAENTELFEQEIKNLGGYITVVYKKDVGHHPHSLEDPTPIVNFILKATGNNNSKESR